MPIGTYLRHTAGSRQCDIADVRAVTTISDEMGTVIAQVSRDEPIADSRDILKNLGTRRNDRPFHARPAKVNGHEPASRGIDVREEVEHRASVGDVIVPSAADVR